MAESARVVRDYIQRGHFEKTISNMQTVVRKIPTAAYCRVSTKSDDQINSYEAQVEYFTRLISTKPEWEFIGVYADPGLSGTSMRRRKEFNRMVADALSGKIGLIVVKSVSRFARNTVDSLSTIRELREKGVKVFFEKENIDSLDSKCDMILSIHASLAEDESRSISTNIRWRKQKQVESGEVSYNMGLIYGYRQAKTDSETGQKKPVTICEEEAEVVREIYFKYLIGNTYRNIIDDLESRGIKPPSDKHNKSGRWHLSTIKSILASEKYAGDFLLQKTYMRDFLSERRVKNTGQAPQKYVENNHPAIIDRTTWNAVQAEIERRANLRSTEQTGKGRYSGQYAFSGRIECGCCGAGFRRHNYRGEGVWACKQHIRSKEICGQIAIKENYLEAVFVRTLNELIRNRKEIAKVVGTAVCEAMVETCEGTDVADRIRELDIEIESLQAQMLELNKKRGKREVDSETYNAESRKVMERLDSLFVQRDGLVQEKSATALNAAFENLVADFLDDITEQIEFDKEIFIKLVEVVRIKGKGHIVFEMKDGTPVSANIDGITG